MLYFAYGSNLIIADTRQRCPDARLVGRAVLPDHRFMVAACGYASVNVEKGAAVHGLLWEISAEDEQRLDAYEQIEHGLYRKERVIVVDEKGAPTPALIYVAVNGEEGRIRDDDLTALVGAAREHGFPAEYVRELEGWR